jgi:hypothetical protein
MLYRRQQLRYAGQRTSLAAWAFYSISVFVMARSLYSEKRDLILKAREAMLSAVQIFNNPLITFKTESFIVALCHCVDLFAPCALPLSAGRIPVFREERGAKTF